MTDQNIDLSTHYIQQKYLKKKNINAIFTQVHFVHNDTDGEYSSWKQLPDPWCVFKLQKLEVWHDLFSSSLMGLQIAYFSVGEDQAEATIVENLLG